MISPALHPYPIRAACEPRRRWAFALTPRSIALLIVGFALLVPGFWDGRLHHRRLAATHDQLAAYRLALRRCRRVQGNRCQRQNTQTYPHTLIVGQACWPVPFVLVHPRTIFLLYPPPAATSAL